MKYYVIEWYQTRPQHLASQQCLHICFGFAICKLNLKKYTTWCESLTTPWLCGKDIYAMVGSIPHDIALIIWYALCGMHRYITWSCDILFGHLVCFFDHVVCFFQNYWKLQFRIFKGKWPKPWHRKKTKFVWCMRSYSTCWEPSCTTPDLRSCSEVLGTQLVEYGPTHDTIIWFSLKTKWYISHVVSHDLHVHVLTICLLVWGGKGGGLITCS